MIPYAAFVWLEFALCMVLIGAAGGTLSRYADVISARTGLSRTWIGVVMLATITSLPEVVTGISAVALAEAPELAVGDVLGSCVFNLAILAVLDGLHRPQSIYSRVGRGHVLTASFGILLIGYSGLSILLATGAGALSIGHVGVYAFVIVGLYAMAMHDLFEYEQQRTDTLIRPLAERYEHITLRRALLSYTAAALVVVAAGTWLPFLGEDIAEVMGWQETFVGTLFMALATSVPELVVTLAALRMGAPNMAVGNLLGSNLFNVLTLAINDAFYLPGPLLAHVSPLHAVSVVAAVLMTGVVVTSLLAVPRRRLLGTVGWGSLAIALLYLADLSALRVWG